MFSVLTITVYTVIYILVQYDIQSHGPHQYYHLPSSQFHIFSVFFFMTHSAKSQMSLCGARANYQCPFFPGIKIPNKQWITFSRNQLPVVTPCSIWVSWARKMDGWIQEHGSDPEVLSYLTGIHLSRRVNSQRRFSHL